MKNNEQETKPKPHVTQYMYCVKAIPIFFRYFGLFLSCGWQLTIQFQILLVINIAIHSMMCSKNIYIHREKY